MSEESEHSLRGPSGAHRWRRCHGSINAERGRPDNVRREAAEGTVFHEYAAMCLMFDLEPEDFPLGVIHKQDGYEIAYDEDMQRYMHAGLDWARAQMEPGDIVIVEQKVDISRWAGTGEFGTCDLGIIKPVKRMIIDFDWKYGKGVPVSPVKNDQSYLYTCGLWHEWAEAVFAGIAPVDIKVIFNIEQPRAPGGGGIWETTMDEVLAEGVLIRLDALETMNPNAKRTAGEKQCMFCKASGDCAEQQEYLLTVFGQRYDEIAENIADEVGPAFETPAKLSLEARSFILLHWKAFKRYVDQIHALTLHDLRAGKEVPLLKAVDGRPGKRFYKPDYIKAAEAAMVEMVGIDKAYQTKLIGPAVAEKIVGKKTFKANMSAYVEQPKGKPILVPTGDKREPIQDFPSKFDDLPDDDDEGNEGNEDD